MDTTTLRHQGHVPGRARRVAIGRTVAAQLPSLLWREPAFGGCGATGVGMFATAYAGTTNPADGTGLTSVKPTTRHLAARST